MFYPQPKISLNMGYKQIWREEGPQAQDLNDVSVVSAWTLAFKHRRLEVSYKQRHSTRARLHDQQAAAVYLTMVASGTALHLIMFSFLQQQQHKQYYKEANTCMNLIVFSWLGPALHLAILACLPERLYIKHRTPITLALRLLYLYGTAVNGYGHCHVGREGTHAVDGRALESIFSAFVWRSGIVGLLWYAAAFPLLFWQHCLVQGAFLAAYWVALAPAVCADIDHIQLGEAATAGAAPTVQLLWSQLLAAARLPISAANTLSAALSKDSTLISSRHVTMSAAAAAAGDVGTGVQGWGGSCVACLKSLRWLEFAVGYALPTFALYCMEMRSRVHWWRCIYDAQLRRIQQDSQQQQHSSNGSSSSGRNTKNENECTAAGDGDTAISATVCAFCGLPSNRNATSAVPSSAATNQAAAACGGSHNAEENLQHQQQQQSNAPESNDVSKEKALLSSKEHSLLTASASSADSLLQKGINDKSPCTLKAVLSTHTSTPQQQQQPTTGKQHTAMLACSCSGGPLLPDAFYLECQQADLPPTSREVLVLLLVLALVYNFLGHVLA